MWRNDSQRKLRLISKLTASQTGKQIVTIQTLHNIPGSKCKQTIKFGQSNSIYNRNIFLQITYRKWGRRLMPGLILFFENVVF